VYETLNSKTILTNGRRKEEGGKKAGDKVFFLFIKKLKRGGVVFCNRKGSVRKLTLK